MLQNLSKLGTKLTKEEMKATKGAWGGRTTPCFWCLCDYSNPPAPESNCCCVN
ncbi:hypothetical protein [Aquimarina brevivitae]|uniref:Uncharacterized protein n=1 Tax=Aquimarina brevivitae TaxID=323412 RepID=A0A4Q7NYX7_9FLAO|nr:hypothetical protein [Aquimarina brevivitae]RZS92457.1 hypothetical protein EV197_2595 [Aquimarina brevivitae]